MQLQSDKSHRLEEIKTQFRAREGYYRLMNSPDYSQRSQRAMGFSTGTTNSNSSNASNEKTCIKISLVTVNDDSSHPDINRKQQSLKDQPSLGSNSMNSANLRVHRATKSSRDKKICFNVGSELFVYNYDGVRTGPDASHPIYKRSYKGSAPTCHDFNQSTATPGSVSLLVGFSHGQVQLVNLNDCGEQDACRELNNDRLIDKTRVTCVKWLPNSPSLFLVAHASGQLYLYKDDLPCGPAAPTYQLYKQSEGVVVYTCKTKTTRNPIYKWTIGVQASETTISKDSIGSSNSLQNLENESCSLNEFVFSPCAKYLACVSQDGFLRVYCYDTMELVGRVRSYYGGLSCVCWSPDGKYVVTGGEDDLITVWSFIERRVVARGIGHKSWVSVVAFDYYYTGYDLKDTDVDNDDDEDEDNKEVDDRDLEGEGDEEDEDEIREIEARASSRSRANKSNDMTKSPTFNRNSQTRHANYSPPSPTACNSTSENHPMRSYRFGSVGQDTQLCLWDLNDDLLKQPIAKPKVSSIGGATSVINLLGPSSSTGLADNRDQSNQTQQKLGEISVKVKSSETLENRANNSSEPSNSKDVSSSSTGGFLSSKGSSFTKTFSLVGKRDKRNLSQRSNEKSSNSKNNANFYNGNPGGQIDDPTKLLGSPICPRINEVPLLEPSVCKKISFERLTSLIFCKGGFITSCQDGYVFSWARPSRRSTKTSPRQSNEELRVIDVATSSMVL